jgi:hypothetical protein
MRDVVVFIVGFRCVDAIAACLASLNGSTHRVRSVCICENGGAASYDALLAMLGGRAYTASGAASATACDEIERTLVLKPSGSGGAITEIVVQQAKGNLGYAGAINAMLATFERRRDWTAIWVLNPDTEPAPGALAALVARADQGGYGIVGSRLVVKHSGRVQLYGGRWRRWLGRGYNIGLGAPAEADIDAAWVEREQQYVSGAAMFVSRAFVSEVGPMSEDYFLYAEEVDWCLRRGRFRLGYAHDSIVVHEHGATIGSSVDRKARSALSVFLDERSRLLLTRRFFPVIFPVAAAATLLLTTQYLKAGAWRNFRYALAGWSAGLRGETGFPSRFAPAAETTAG